jgi:hypothetical protein
MIRGLVATIVWDPPYPPLAVHLATELFYLEQDRPFNT